MFSHVIVGVNDLEASRRFYDTLLGTLGNQADAFHAVGVANGGTTCEDPPAQGVIDTFLIAADAHPTSVRRSLVTEMHGSNAKTT